MRPWRVVEESLCLASLWGLVLVSLGLVLRFFAFEVREMGMGGLIGVLAVVALVLVVAYWLGAPDPNGPGPKGWV